MDGYTSSYYGRKTLGAKCGDELIIQAEGEDEDAAVEALKAFVEQYL